MKIVVTNDDGPHSYILPKVVEWLTSEGHRVVVVVPERPRSAAGLARTYHKPLRVKKLGDFYVVNGYPSDAVFLAVKLIAPDVELIISGVNLGENIGVEATFGSGTVGAAIQGGVLGVPAAAISMENGADLSLVRRVMTAVVGATLRDALAYIINIPSSWSGGVACPVKLAKSVYTEQLYSGEDPRGEVFYWRWGPRSNSFDRDSDAYYFYMERHITVVALAEHGLGDASMVGNALGKALGASVLCGEKIKRRGD